MDARTRVLLLTPDFPPAVGGIQLLLGELVRHSPRLQARVVTLRSSGPLDSTEPPQGEVRTVRRVPGGQAPSMLALNAAAMVEACRFRPEVVVMGHIVTSPAAWMIRRVLGTPTILYLYADELGARPSLSRFALRNADLAVAISRHTRRLALDLGADPRRLRRLAPGVELPSGRRAERDRQPTVVTVASLDYRYKGHDVMARAMPLVLARVPDARWVVVGDGALRGQIERLAAAQSLNGRAQFVGVADRDERDRWLERAHVFAMPSRLPPHRPGGEGFGIVYLEAAAHGLPVVAGGVGGACDAVVHDETGLLIDPTDHVAVADAIADLLLDPDRAEGMGRAAARRACEFEWSIIGRRFEDLVMEVGAAARCASST